MCKNVLILSSSPRKGGNSETLAAAFAKGAQEAGNQVETVYLREMQYGFCKGCLASFATDHSYRYSSILFNSVKTEIKTLSKPPTDGRDNCQPFTLPIGSYPAILSNILKLPPHTHITIS